jgi:hypothetical protein
LRWVSKSDFADGIPEKQGKAIYLFIDSHMQRVVGNLSLTQAIPRWREFLPNYFLDDAGNLHSDGMLSNGRPVESWLFHWLSLSEFFRYHKIDIPFRFADRHFRLFATILKELKDQLAAKAGIQDFYVAIYPHSILGKPLIPYLDRLGISSIDYSDVNLNQYVQTMSIPHDGHPSAEADRFLAEQLIRDLKL